MKKFVVIDDHGLSGYGIIEVQPDFAQVCVNIEQAPKPPFAAPLTAQLKNGVSTYNLGTPKRCGTGLQLKCFFPFSEFSKFNPDLPCKIKFEFKQEKKEAEQAVCKDKCEPCQICDTAEEEKIKSEEESTLAPKLSPAELSGRLAKYIRVYDVFNGEYSTVTWYRIHDVEMISDTELAKKVFSSLGVTDLLTRLCHYLIGIDSDGTLYYAIPARYEIDSYPFDNTDFGAEWLPVFGKSKTKGHFGYFVISEHILQRASA